MHKINSQKVSDEQLDRLAEIVFRSVILNDEETEKIAESPLLLRQIKNHITAEKARREESRWFFFGWNWRLAAVAFGALVILFAASAGVWFYNPKQMEVAVAPNEKIVSDAKGEINVPDSNVKPEVMSPAILPAKIRQKISAEKSGKENALKLAPKLSSIRVLPAPRKLPATSQPKTEIATNFIALSYLPASESGQILRVKVPRSMMVALGVTTDTERNSELVNAEVIIGDDGAARSIRFIDR